MKIKATTVFQKNWNSKKKIIVNQGGQEAVKLTHLLNFLH